MKFPLTGGVAVSERNSDTQFLHPLNDKLYENPCCSVLDRWLLLFFHRLTIWRFPSTPNPFLTPSVRRIPGILHPSAFPRSRDRPRRTEEPPTAIGGTPVTAAVTCRNTHKSRRVHAFVKIRSLQLKR